MALAHFRMLIYEFLNKDQDILPKAVTMIVLDSKSTLCIANNGKDTTQTRHISSRMHLVRNGEKWKMHNIEWCEGGLQLADIATKNFGEHDLTPVIKYIMVRIDNWDRTLVQEGWQDIRYSME